MRCELPPSRTIEWNAWPIKGIYAPWSEPSRQVCERKLEGVFDHVETYAILRPGPHWRDSNLRTRLHCAGLRSVNPFRFRYSDNHWGVEARRLNRTLFAMRAADHVLIMLDATRRRCNHTLVAEQDVAFRDWAIDAASIAIIRDVFETRRDWDVFFLGHIPLRPYSASKMFSRIVTTQRPIATHLYATSRHGRSAILEFVGRRHPSFAWSRQGLLEHSILPHVRLNMKALRWSIAYQDHLPHSVFEYFPWPVTALLTTLGPDIVSMSVEVAATYGVVACVCFINLACAVLLRKWPRNPFRSGTV